MLYTVIVEAYLTLEIESDNKYEALLLAGEEVLETAYPIGDPLALLNFTAEPMGEKDGK